MFLLDPGDKESVLVDWQLEVLDHLVQGVGERLVVHVSEHVVDATVLKKIFLRKITV